MLSNYLLGVGQHISLPLSPRDRKRSDSQPAGLEHMWRPPEDPPGPGKGSSRIGHSSEIPLPCTIQVTLGR